MSLAAPPEVVYPDVNSAIDSIQEHAKAHGYAFYIVNSGLSRLHHGHQDTYEPGTQGGRAYMRGLSSIWHTEQFDIGTATADLIEKEVIEVDVDTIEVEVN
jgi:hypothetical protein